MNKKCGCGGEIIYHKRGQVWYCSICYKNHSLNGTKMEVKE